MSKIAFFGNTHNFPEEDESPQRYWQMLEELQKNPVRPRRSRPNPFKPIKISVKKCDRSSSGSDDPITPLSDQSDGTAHKTGKDLASTNKALSKTGVTAERTSGAPQGKFAGASRRVRAMVQTIRALGGMPQHANTSVTRDNKPSRPEGED